MTKLAETESLFDAAEVLEGLDTTPRRWRPHHDVKQTDYPWLGAIPRRWTTVPLKRVFAIVNGATPKSSEPLFWDGDIPWCTPEDLGDLEGNTVNATKRSITQEGYQSCGTSIVPPRSLIISSRAPIGHLAIAGTGMCTNQGCKALVPLGDRCVDYLYYQLLALRAHLQSLGQGSTFIELSRAQLGTVRLAEPPLAEQRAIAGFLRRETAKIDALVQKKRRLIDLLKEKRTAFISQAISKGIDPTAKLVAVDVEEFGRIPAHWVSTRLMILTEPGHRIMYGIVLPGPNFPGGVPIVKGGDVERGPLQRDRLACTDPEIEAGYERSRLRTGDLVYAIRGSIGACQPVPEECHGVNITQDTAKIAPRGDVNRRWLLYALRSQPVFQQLEARALGATIRGINIRDLKRCYLPVPPAHEQAAIADYLDGVVGTLDRTERLAESAIDQLVEYRSALIAAAVTGKIDVRGEVE